MIIALKDQDKTDYPNLALMKISAFHRASGDKVVFYDDIFSNQYDLVYTSKVFTFTKEEKLHGNVEKGGSGFDINSRLPDEIDSFCPDYSLYNLNYSIGFLTRGCFRNCKHCIVPEKEGSLIPYADIQDFLKHDKAVLMDNNVLGSDYGISQIEKIISLKLKVDFNQGLDARLIDDSIAKLLSKVHWYDPIKDHEHPLRLACDSSDSIKHIEKAVRLLRWRNVKPTRYFVYCLIEDFDEALERIKYLKGLYLDIFAQPFIDKDGNMPDKKLQKLARWVNFRSAFKGVWWEDYKYK